MVASFFIRLTGLKKLLIEGRSDAGSGFFAPKNTDGLAAREIDRGLALGAGLDGIADAPAGVNVFAAGLGLNSCALTLNFVEVADVGLCIDLCELLRLDGSPAKGPLGGMRPS